MIIPVILGGLMELFFKVFAALVIILVHFHMVLHDGPVILILPNAQERNQTGHLLLQGTVQNKSHKYTALTKSLKS